MATDYLSVDAVCTPAQMDAELIIQAGVGRMTPHQAARATLALDGLEIERLIEKMKSEAYDAGYRARLAEEAREEEDRERQFFEHARLITRISELPDRD